MGIKRQTTESVILREPEEIGKAALSLPCKARFHHMASSSRLSRGALYLTVRGSHAIYGLGRI